MSRRKFEGYTVAGDARLAAEWHPTRNAGLDPSQVSYGSGMRVWWRCSRGPDHEWRATPNARTSNRTGCPFCANTRVSVTNSLAAIAPRVAAEWDNARNSCRADEVVAFSSRPAWWRCAESDDHVWRTSPNQRVSKKTNCPFCAGKHASLTNSLATSAPQIAREWHPTRNGRLTPKTIVRGSTRRVWWRCRHGHVWRATVRNRVVGASGCPRCVGRSPR